MSETGKRGRVLIKCIPNNRAFLKYAITVSNSQNETIFQGNTSKKGIAEFKVNECDLYQIKVESQKCLSPRAAYRWVTLSPQSKCSLYFIFNAAFSSHCITKPTFYLTDQNYSGLPISKGELYLWHVPM